MLLVCATTTWRAELHHGRVWLNSCQQRLQSKATCSLPGKVCDVVLCSSFHVKIPSMSDRTAAYMLISLATAGLAGALYISSSFLGGLLRAAWSSCFFLLSQPQGSWLITQCKDPQNDLDLSSSRLTNRISELKSERFSCDAKLKIHLPFSIQWSGCSNSLYS